MFNDMKFWITMNFLMFIYWKANEMESLWGSALQQLIFMARMHLKDEDVCVCVCCHMSKRSAIIINLRQICDIRVHYPIFLLHTNIVKVSFRWISQFDCWTADDLFELNKDDGFALTDSKPIPLFTDHRTFNVHIHHMCVQFRILSTSIFNLNFYIR